MGIGRWIGYVFPKAAPAVVVTAVPATAQTDQELDLAQTLRQDYGFPSSKAVARASYADREIYSDMSRGIPLTPAEAAELDRRRDIVWGSGAARDFARTLEGYADVYIDQHRGGIPVFRFTGDLEANRSAMAEVMPDWIDFDVQLAEFTFKQLRKKQDRITEDMLETDWLLDGDIQLVSAGASVKANRVLVGLLRQEDSARALEVLQERYGPMVDVEYIGPTEEDARTFLPLLPTKPSHPLPPCRRLPIWSKVPLGRVRRVTRAGLYPTLHHYPDSNAYPRVLAVETVSRCSSAPDPGTSAGPTSV